jgi:hypothetical protein
MEGSNTSSEMQIVTQEETATGEVVRTWDNELREKPNYQIARAFWNSPAGKRAIKKARARF